MYFVYVLRNAEGRLYVGFTADLKRRMGQHRDNEGGWTRDKGPWELVFYEAFANRSEALRRERSLKRGRANQCLRIRFGHGGE